MNKDIKQTIFITFLRLIIKILKQCFKIVVKGLHYIGYIK